MKTDKVGEAGHTYKIEEIAVVEARAKQIADYKAANPEILSDDGVAIANTAFKNKTVPADFKIPS